MHQLRALLVPAARHFDRLPGPSGEIGLRVKQRLILWLGQQLEVVRVKRSPPPVDIVRVDVESPEAVKVDLRPAVDIDE